MWVGVCVCVYFIQPATRSLLFETALKKLLLDEIRSCCYRRLFIDYSMQNTDRASLCQMYVQCAASTVICNAMQCIGHCLCSSSRLAYVFKSVRGNTNMNAFISAWKKMRCNGIQTCTRRWYSV